MHLKLRERYRVTRALTKQLMKEVRNPSDEEFKESFGLFLLLIGYVLLVSLALCVVSVLFCSLL